MLKRLLPLLIILLLIFSSFGYTQNQEQGVTYVVPIKGEINKATYYYLRDVLQDLENENVDAVIFEIDTYGGLIDQATKIKDLIISSNIPTISYVNNKAQSAGVLITIASEKVVVAPNATIGSAETVPNTEKILAYWRSVLRDTAQYRNRDYEIIEAMADKDMTIEGLSPKGKLVNLTSNEAVEYGVADYSSDDYQDILSHFNIENSKVVHKSESLTVKLAKYISSPTISSLLLTIGFIGLIVEILTPGFGLGGTISIIGFGLFFGGNILAGNSSWVSLALFVTGLILLIIEAVVPGFGLPGISGIVLVFVGTVLAMDNLVNAIISISVAIIITSIVTIILMKFGFRSKLLDRIVLDTKMEEDKGYLSVKSMNELLNKEGTTISELRPTGFIDIDGVKYDALSDAGFITKNTPIQVIRVEGAKIFVRRR